ncbi:MAG: glycosyltransferase family 4 protein [Bacteroidales bacterium]|nr:glycosyltransferase family 4 protein [Bacteroidales bacterium]
MRIAVNTRLLLKDRLEGIGWFTYETMKRITQGHPEHEFFFLFDRKFDPDFIFSSNIKPVVLKPQSRHPVLWFVWFEISVKKFIRRNKIDLFISPDGYLPLRSNIPMLGVIHDINFFHFPKTIPFLVRWYYNFFFPKFAHKASRLATVSEYSKKDICQNYVVDPGKIDVVYNGANDLYAPLSSREIEKVRSFISQGSSYFVFVGAFNPRKNIPRLLLAFDLFKKKTHSNIKLVIVGEKMYGTSQMMMILQEMEFKDEVIFSGRLQVDKLKNVIGSALAMIYVSYYEGFGIPILEAMKCDVPLVVSNCTSLPEVSGDAAIYVDPFNVESIAEGMVTIYDDEILRKELIVNARIQRKKFSWDGTAKSLYESMMKTVNQ